MSPQIVIFYNVVMPDRPRLRRGAVDLPDIGVKIEDWGSELRGNASFTDAWEFGVPLEAGFKIGDRVSQVLSLTVAASNRETIRPRADGRPRVIRGRSGALKSARSFCVSCACAVDADRTADARAALQDFPSDQRSSLFALLRGPASMGIRLALGSILDSMEEQLLDWKPRIKNNKDALNKELDRWTGLGRVLQRAAYGAPVQLGWSDLEEFVVSRDPCRFGPGVGPGRMLGKQCSCGVLSFRSNAQKHFGDVAPESMWAPYVVHQLKNNCIHAFLAGEITYSGTGNVLVPACANDVDCSLDVWDTLILDHPVVDPDHVRDHVALVAAEEQTRAVAAAAAEKQTGAGADVFPALANGEKGSLFVEAVERGELHLCLATAGTDEEPLLRLQRGTSVRGRVFVCIGEYVGAEANAIAALKRSLRTDPSPCCRSLLPEHGVASAGGQRNPSVFRQMSSEEILKQSTDIGKKFTNAQMQFIRRALDREDGAALCEAYPGTGKSATAAGIIANAASHCSGNAKCVALAQQRAMRDELLSNIRSALDDPLAAAGVGRPADEAPSDDDGYLDSQLLSAVSGRFTDLQMRIEELRNDLAAVRCNPDEGTLERREWLEKTELIRHLCFECDALQEEAAEKLFHDVRVFAMTIDAFNHVQSGRSWLSRIFKRFEIAFVIIDEVHQANFGEVYAALQSAPSAVVYLDSAQEIRHRPATEFLREPRPDRAGNYYEWQMACHGKSRVRAWDHVPADSVLSLPVAHRFGPAPAKLLRAISAVYGRPGREIKCAIECARESGDSSVDLSIAPYTAMRFVFYRGARWIPSLSRGVLADDAEEVGQVDRAAPGSSAAGATRSRTSTLRAGASDVIFAQMLFEGLFFLRVLARGEVSKRVGGPRMSLESTTKAVLTMILANDVGVNFATLLRGALEGEEVRAAFGLPDFVADAPKLWRAMTPEAAMGSDGLLAQTTLFPRDLSAHDLQGHAKEPNRHASGLHLGCRRRLDIEKIDCRGPGAEKPARPEWFTSPGGAAGASQMFRAVTTFRSPIPRVVANLRNRAARAQVRPLTAQPISIAQAVGDACEWMMDRGALPTAAREQTSQAMPLQTSSWVSQPDMHGLASDPTALHAVRSQLLKHLGVVVQNGRAAITAMYLDATRARDDEAAPHSATVERAMAAGRVIALHAVQLFPDAFAAEFPLRATLMPRKRLRLGGAVLRESWEARAALALALERPGGGDPRMLMYQFLGDNKKGNRASADPPNTFPLHFRDMPINVAQALAATLLFFTGAEISGKMVVVRPRAPTPEHRKEAADVSRDIIYAVNSMSGILRRRHGPPADVHLPRAPNSAGADAARKCVEEAFNCILCSNTGVLEYFSSQGGKIREFCMLCETCNLRSGSGCWPDDATPCPACAV
ncbi:unnamed protein product [Prorocentrum cordatum]|uniref:DNA helicase n=1 Tax=Prorocentrum cordatum TaxID=2364126 RepID=A0ABN9UMK8_9DINO|nr:unnamed protein product [Polarella glacialis]